MQRNETHLDLADGQVEEGHSLANLDNRLGSNAAHRRAKSSVELENGELVEEGWGGAFGKIGVRHDLLRRRGLDLVPVAVRRIRAARKGKA